MPATAMDQSTVVILNKAGVRARYLPALADAAKLYQVVLVGAAIGAPFPSATASPASMLYDTPESQLKREAREEKLAAVTVCLRGDLQAINAFVVQARDLGHDSVLARIYPMLSVAQCACPWARPECLPLFIRFLFSGAEGSRDQFDSAALVAYFQVGFRGQIETVSQIELCAQAMCPGFTTLYCQPGSPLYKLDPLFFYNITVPLLEQLRSTSHQRKYLSALPINNCVVQAFNGCLAALGLYMRNRANAPLPFAEFQAGAMMATIDLKPRETVMGAYTAIHCQELFVVQQFSRFDGKSMSAPTVPAISYPPQSRKRPLPQSGPPLSAGYFTGQCSSESQPCPPCPNSRTDPISRWLQSGTARGPIPRWWGPSVSLCLGLRFKDRRSPLSPRMHDFELSSSPCAASRARLIRRSGQGRVTSVAYERYASGTHDRVDSRTQLVRLVASPRRLMRYFGSFSLFFFQLAEMNWIGCLLKRM